MDVKRGLSQDRAQVGPATQEIHPGGANGKGGQKFVDVCPIPFPHNGEANARHSGGRQGGGVQTARTAEGDQHGVARIGTFLYRHAAHRPIHAGFHHLDDSQRGARHIAVEFRGEASQGGPGGGSSPSAPSVTTELQRLADLRDKGVLTEAEFQNQKKKVLGQ